MRLRLLVAVAALAGLFVAAPLASASTPWVRVVDDRFDSGGVPAHWDLYDGPYGSGTGNCASPAHLWVGGGAMHLLMRWEASGRCGAAWYTAGMQVAPEYWSVDQRVTLRWRVVSAGATSHRIIPMRFPDSAPWPAGGEEDYCEGSAVTGCSTFLHYGSTAPGSQVMTDYAIGSGLGSWHTMRFQRRGHVVKAWIATFTTPAWTYRGDATTLPDTIKRVVLQQECRSAGCPSGTTGTEDIQIDWIRIADPPPASPAG
jgi:hypothetical protein